jgi:hypothetical protein
MARGSSKAAPCSGCLSSPPHFGGRSPSLRAQLSNPAMDEMVRGRVPKTGRVVIFSSSCCVIRRGAAKSAGGQQRNRGLFLFARSDGWSRWVASTRSLLGVAYNGLSGNKRPIRHCEQSEAIQTWAAHLRLSLDCFAVARNDGVDRTSSRAFGRLCGFQFCFVRLRDVRRLFLQRFFARRSRASNS